MSSSPLYLGGPDQVQALDWGKKLYDVRGGYDAVTKLVTTGLKGTQAFVTSKTAMVFTTHAANALEFKGRLNFPLRTTYWRMPVMDGYAFMPSPKPTEYVQIARKPLDLEPLLPIVEHWVQAHPPRLA
jgi:hypothetical protein